MTNQRIKFRGEYDDAKYWERVDRSLGWLGATAEEQKKTQKKLRDTVIGVSGCGGIGGAVAARLARLGVRHIKLADPDSFDVTNINRQMGANFDNVGRNKAEVVADMVHEITPDVTLEVFAEGIIPSSAEEFMHGCDYVMDQMDFYEIGNRYALHRAFRKSDSCKFMFKIPTVGHSVFVFKYTKDSMPIEDVYELPEDATITPEVTRRLMERIIPEMPSYPNTEMLDHWFVDLKRMPIFAACPPLAEGILVERLAQAITGLDQLPNAQQLPAQPGYALFDTLTWKSKVVHGQWWE
ncbi:MAG: ThiF family adenylyltransferase [Gammaproteobacteria bacterium]|nr:ThiF family adenylyltransferase [Gammaproteobacteria bacterium]